MRPDATEVWRWIAEVPDPGIPVISVMDLGIVRDVAWEGDTLAVTVTPTYSGCPATALIALQIEAALRARGVEKLALRSRISPPWTADWISAEGREKHHAYGVASPVDGTAPAVRRAARLLGEDGLVVPCPRSGSTETERVRRFGSTPCKAA